MKYKFSAILITLFEIIAKLVVRCNGKKKNKIELEKY